MFKFELACILWIVSFSQTSEDMTLELKIRQSNKDSSKYKLNLDGHIRKKFTALSIMSKQDENIICSPISILPPLAKLAIGATGQTLKELEEAIGTKRNQIRLTMRKFINTLRSVNGVTLNIMTKLFRSKKYKLKSNYKREIRKIFRTDIEGINFNDRKEAASKINKLVREESNGVIKQIVSTSDLDENTILILLAVVYFEGKWIMKRGFSTSLNATFNAPSGPTTVEMMQVSYTLNYAENNDINAQVLEIPYKGGESSFILVLPKNTDGLQNIVYKIGTDPKILNNIVQSLRPTEVYVSMPKFKIITTLDLKPLLKKLNVLGIFNGEGLDNMIKYHKKLYIQKAIQKSIITVHEKGTTATSATGAVATITAGMVTHKKIIADHPFLFYIMVKGEQLFSGVFNGNEEVKRINYNDLQIYSESDDFVYGRNNDYSD